MPKRSNHRQRFANPACPTPQLPTNVIPLQSAKTEYGAFIEKDDANRDHVVFRFANKTLPSKPVELFGTLPWTTMPKLTRPFADAAFALGRPFSNAQRYRIIRHTGIFLEYIAHFCKTDGISSSSFSLCDITTCHFRGYIRNLNDLIGESGKPLSIRTKRLYYRTAVCIIQHLQSHPYYKTLIQKPEFLLPPRTPWQQTEYNSTPRQPLSVASIADLQDACEAECLKWLAMREDGCQMIMQANALLNEYDHTGNLPRDLSDCERLSLALAYLNTNGNLCAYLSNRKVWLKENGTFACILKRTQYKSLNNILPYICSTARVLIPFYLLLAVKTAFNRTTVDEVRTDAIHQSPIFPNSIRIIATEQANDSPQQNDERYAIIAPKPRARRDQIRTYRLNDPDDQLNVGALVQHVRALTDSIRSIADPDSVFKLFIYPRKASCVPNPSSNFVVRHPHDRCTTFSKALSDFINDNNLQSFQINQIRAGMNVISEIITGGDIIQQAALLNHSSFNVTDSHYTSTASRGRQREKIAEVQNSRERFITTNGRYDPRNLMTSGTHKAITLGFECADPYDSPIAGQIKGRACDAHGECPRCPFASVNTTDPAAFAYLVRLDKSIEDGKPTLNDFRWLHIWQPIQMRLHLHMAKFTDPTILASARQITLRPLPPVD
jgi:hypothetical protein